MTEIQSAEELFALLAGDDSEVPLELIRQGKGSVSRHAVALEEQAQLASLNKTEEFMLSEGAVASNIPEFVSLGETLYLALCESRSTGLSVSVTQKMTKLNLIWLKVTKSGRLVEEHVSESHVIGLLSALEKAWLNPTPVLSTCGRVIVSLLQSSPSRLFVSPEIIEWFNSFIRKWAKNYRGNGQSFLHQFPIEFLAQVTWVPSVRPFTFGKIIESTTRLMKKTRCVPKMNLYKFSKCLDKMPNSKSSEEVLVKFAGTIVRMKIELTPKFASWLEKIAEKNAGKASQLAKLVLVDQQ